MTTKTKPTWRTMRLDDVCPIVFSGGTPDTRISAYWQGDLPWLSSGETSQTYITKTEKHISESAVQNSSTRPAKAGDIVIATAGQGSTRGQTAMLKIDTYINQSIIALRPNKDELDSTFLFYNLHLRYPELRSLSDSTSSRGSITGPLMKGLSLKFPDISEQKRIVEVLVAFDEKIENNNRIIKTLEELAQAIFKERFDISPEALPKGWEMKPLDKVANFLNGLAMQKYRPHKDEDALPVIKIREMNNGIDNNTEVASSSIEEKYKVKAGDILFSWSGSLELMRWAGRVGVLNQHLFKVTSEDYPNWFIFYWILKYLPFFRVIASGKATSMGHIQRHHLSEAQVVVPSSTVLNKANDLISPMFKKALESRMENQKLASMRDLLLPRLMSGELQV